jgi:hypothetical protein
MPGHGSPVPILKFQNAPRPRFLTSSGSKKKEAKYECLREDRAHTKSGLRFHALLHISYIRDCWSAPIIEDVFSEC